MSSGRSPRWVVCAACLAAGCRTETPDETNADAAAPGGCPARTLALALEPTPEASVSGRLHRIAAAGDTLEIDVEDAGATNTYRVRGPFSELTPAALEGLDSVEIEVSARAPGDFWLSLRGCDRPELRVVSAGRAVIEPLTGPIEEYLDESLACGEGCPRSYGLRLNDVSVPPGGEASTLTQRVIAGRVAESREERKD